MNAREYAADALHEGPRAAASTYAAVLVLTKCAVWGAALAGLALVPMAVARAGAAYLAPLAGGVG